MNKKFLQFILVVILCTSPFILAGCGLGDMVLCTQFDDNADRLFLCGSGRTGSGIEYKSCVGPAGCTGIGLGTKCWPTECVTIETKDDVKGNITFFDGVGCIDSGKPMSSGHYTEEDVSCLGISCAATMYEENKDLQGTTARQVTTCFNIACADEGNVSVKGYNDNVPRLFPKGCWTCGEAGE